MKMAKKIGYKIKLRKCAYIFDDSYNSFSCGREDSQRKAQKQKILKRFFESDEERGKEFDATVETVNNYSNGEPIKVVKINIDGVQFQLNALEIASSSNANEIYNHRSQKDFSNFDSSKVEKQSKNWLISKKFNSLHFEAFTSVDGLGYYRFNFKRNHYCFIIDERNGDILTAYGIEHKKITRGDIFKALEVGSIEARKEVSEVLDYLQNRSNQAVSV